jgi:hypothetical protein
MQYISALSALVHLVHLHSQNPYSLCHFTDWYVCIYTFSPQVPIDSQAEYDEALKVSTKSSCIFLWCVNRVIDNVNFVLQYLLRAKNPVSLRVRTTVDERKAARAKTSSSVCGKLRAKDIERHLRKLQKEATKLGVERPRHVATTTTTVKECSHTKSAEKLKHKCSHSCSTLPAWFDKYMQKVNHAGSRDLHSSSTIWFM